MPTISPNGGTFCAPVEVSIATTEPDGVILYTVDGTLPATGNGVVYSGPFLLYWPSTVNAITTAPGKFNSYPATTVFEISGCGIPEVQPIVLTPGSMTSDNDVEVTLTTGTTGATICYTTEGMNPTCSAQGQCQTGTTYSGTPVAITQTGTVLIARGCLMGMNPSPTSQAEYTLQAGPVLFTPPAGTVAVGTTVTMESSTQAAEIRYLVDGTDPTCATGTLFTDPVPISADTTFRAIACKSAYVPSDVSAAAYVPSN